MLNAIPNSALSFAIDGVLIPASVLGLTKDAAALLETSQKHAAEQAMRAERDAFALRRDARVDGYREGIHHGISAMAACASDTASMASRLVDGALAKASERLRAGMREAGVEEAMIEAYCRIGAGADTPSVTLRVPIGHDAFADEMRTRLHSLDIAVELGGVACPSLDLGHIAFDFVAEQTVLSEALASIRLTDADRACIERIATSYADGVTASLRQMTSHEQDFT